MRTNLVLPALLAALAANALAQTTPPRPRITGVSHLAVYTSDPAAAEHFYTVTIGAVKMPDPEDPKGVRYAIDNTQFVEVLPLPPGAGKNRMDHAALNTTSAEGMRKYLAVKGWKVPAKVTRGSDGSRWFFVDDPEGNKIQFVQPPANAHVDAPNAISHHLIHFGFLIHNREKEDTFYRDLLGFRPYWYGGMQDNKVDWVSQQVPDGHDWIEYMVSGGPGSGIPESMSERTLGVLNHIALGEQSVDEAFKTLKDSGRLVDVRADNAPKIGRDGKGQLNLYDPDGTRVEMMNLHATEKPCCSPFTASDPTK
ncbi:MAG TPA: VOC family protein [Terracidiphilus sp.]|nr:VOC family protein [Terracidiphilus sp.]